jgi:endonuclease III
MNDYTQNDYIEWAPANMLEIFLNEPDDFLKVKETLSRIGVASRKTENVLYQSCHILHKQGRYFILHFKELFMLDGKPSSFTLDDLRRRNTIAILLSDWGLVRIAKRDEITETTNLKQIKIIPFREKAEWRLEAKYSIGNVKK